MHVCPMPCLSSIEKHKKKDEKIIIKLTLYFNKKFLSHAELKEQRKIGFPLLVKLQVPTHVAVNSTGVVGDSCGDRDFLYSYCTRYRYCPTPYSNYGAVVMLYLPRTVHAAGGAARRLGSRWPAYYITPEFRKISI